MLQTSQIYRKKSQKERGKFWTLDDGIKDKLDRNGKLSEVEKGKEISIGRKAPNQEY